MRLSRYLKIYPCPDRPGFRLIYSTRRASLITVSESALRAIEAGTLSPSDGETLVRLGILVSDPAREKAEMLARFDEANRRRRKFSAMVVLNLDCNLACTYCYEGFVRGKHYMSAETADLLVEVIERDHLSRGKKVSLDFYGGEALLSPGLIKSISGRLQKSAQAKGLEYSFNIVTNGTLLTRPVAQELAAFGLQGAKFTLDGPQNIHDRFRPFVSGKGSFAAIIDNLKAVCDVIKVQVGGNYTRENYREFPRLLDSLLAEGLTPEKLSLVKFDPVSGRAAGAGLPDFKSGCDCTSEPWLHEASLFLREEILKRGFNTPKPVPIACMVEFQDDMVINYDGSIYKCPAFIGWERLAVGDLKTGLSDYRVSHNLDVWKKEECLDCAYLPFCFGGCRFLKLLRDGRIDDVDCRKEFFDATLEELIRQDLRYRPKNG